MGGTLGETLEEHRAQLFVGRERELEVFEEMLLGRRPERVLYVQGPGGTGKTQVLRECARRARSRGLAVGWIDGRAVTPTAQSLKRAVASAFSPVTPPAATRLLIMDGFEHLRGLEAWWKDIAIPSLDRATIVVFAGRARLGEDWLADPGWRALLHVISLGPLSRDEARAYLARRQLEAKFEAIFDATRGHPLAVALLAEILLQDPEAPVSLRDQPEVLRRLVPQFLEEAPSELHARALQATAVVLHTTEPLLRRLLGVASARELFSWLAGLTFMQPTTVGLMPHDSVRGFLLEGLRWQAPERHRELMLGALRHYLAASNADAFWTEDNLRASHFVLSQHHPPMFEAAMFSDFAARPATEDDWPAVEAIVRRHEGAESAALAALWRRAPGEWTVVSRPHQPCCGFVHLAPLREIEPELLARDPGAAAARQHVERVGAWTDRRPVWLIRFCMTAEEYQAPCETQSWLFQRIAWRIVLSQPPAYVLQCIHDVETWKQLQLPTTPQLVPDLGFDLDGRHYGFVALDLRRQSPRQWYRTHFEFFLDQARQEDGAAETRDGGCPPRDPQEYESAVKEALRAIDRPEVLCESPLAHLRIVQARCPDGSKLDRAHALADLLRERAEGFCASERDVILYRALELGYFRPAVKQEAAAAELGVGYSTFRRHLAHATERLAERIRMEEEARSSREAVT